MGTAASVTAIDACAAPNIPTALATGVTEAFSCGAACFLFIKAMIGAAAAYITYKILEYTAPVVYGFFKDVYDRWYAIARFDINDNLVTMGLLEELKAQYPNTMYASVNRRSEGLDFVPSDGWYTIRNNAGDYLFDLNLKDNGTKINVIKYNSTPQQFQQIINTIYTRRAAGVERVSRYSLEQTGWRFAGFRTKTRLNNIVQSDCVNNVIQRVTQFRNSPRPHKTLGLFLEGDSRSGKSLMAMLVASEYNMPIYTLPLDSPFMYDALLGQRVGEIPEGSIIFIDEFHQKVQSLRTRPNTLVTPGGILETLDDQHIPNRCIVILTAISAQETNQIFNNNLIGPGRIDYVIRMERPHDL